MFQKYLLIFIPVSALFYGLVDSSINDFARGLGSPSTQGAKLSMMANINGLLIEGNLPIDTITSDLAKIQINTVIRVSQIDGKELMEKAFGKNDSGTLYNQLIELKVISEEMEKYSQTFNKYQVKVSNISDSSSLLYCKQSEKDNIVILVNYNDNLVGQITPINHIDFSKLKQLDLNVSVETETTAGVKRTYPIRNSQMTVTNGICEEITTLVTTTTPTPKPIVMKQISNISAAVFIDDLPYKIYVANGSEILINGIILYNNIYATGMDDAISESALSTNGTVEGMGSLNVPGSFDITEGANMTELFQMFTNSSLAIGQEDKDFWKAEHVNLTVIYVTNNKFFLGALSTPNISTKDIKSVRLSCGVKNSTFFNLTLFKQPEIVPEPKLESYDLFAQIRIRDYVLNVSYERVNESALTSMVLSAIVSTNHKNKTGTVVDNIMIMDLLNETEENFGEHIINVNETDLVYGLTQIHLNAILNNKSSSTKDIFDVNGTSFVNITLKLSFDDVSGNSSEIVLGGVSFQNETFGWVKAFGADTSINMSCIRFIDRNLSEEVKHFHKIGNCHVIQESGNERDEFGNRIIQIKGGKITMPVHTDNTTSSIELQLFGPEHCAPIFKKVSEEYAKKELHESQYIVYEDTYLQIIPCKESSEIVQASKTVNQYANGTETHSDTTIIEHKVDEKIRVQ